MDGEYSVEIVKMLQHAESEMENSEEAEAGGWLAIDR